MIKVVDRAGASHGNGCLNSIEQRAYDLYEENSFVRVIAVR